MGESFYGATCRGSTSKLAADKFFKAFSHEASYWNERYSADTQLSDWFLQDYTEVLALISAVSKRVRSIRILHVGCGNSTLSEAMYDAGYHDIVNIDVSYVVIQQMLKSNLNRSNMTWLEMDATNMKLGEDSFDAVVDKGMLDTFACVGNVGMATKYLSEVRRVLRPGGTFACFSYAGPSSRLDFFQSPCCDWTCQVLKMSPKHGSERACYGYICTLPTAVG